MAFFYKEHVFLTAYELQEYKRIESEALNNQDLADFLDGFNRSHRRRRQWRPLRAFLSYKFGEPEISDKVKQLKRFLELLDIDVLTGEGYEPRPIEDKILERLRSDVDLLIVLITAHGESAWIRDEMNEARAQQLPIIVIVESSAKFSTGLFGALEYIPFGNCIEQAFLALLEGLKVVRSA
jgi:hypothetical protein